MSTSEFDPNRDIRQEINTEDMPPLGPTAEVPPVNSDKLNDPRYWNKKMEAPAHNEKKGLGKRIAAGVAGIALLGGGILAGTKLAGSDEDPTITSPTQPVATASETSGTSPTTEPTTSEVPTVLERPLYDEWNPSPIVDILDAKTTADEFEKYPIKDRVQYIIEAENWFAGANIGVDYMDQRLPGINKYGEDKVLEDLNYMFNPQTKTTSAQTIIEHQVFIDQLTGYVDENHLASEGYATDTTEIDIDTARKLTSGIYADPTSRSYQLSSNAKKNYPEKARLSDEYVSSIRIVSSTMNYDKVDSEGNNIPHKDIVVQDSDGTYEVTVAFYEIAEPIKSPAGDLTTENGLWLTTYDKRFDSKTN